MRKKKEKSVEKENNSCNSNSNSTTTTAKSNVGKKLSVDNSSEAEVLEEVEEEEEEEEAPTTNILEKVYLQYRVKYFYIFINTQVPLVEEERRAKGSPASLASCGRANSAPSNDSGHVSAEPYSLPSVSSTKVCMNSYYLLGRYTKISHNFPISGNVYFFFPSLGS